MGVAGSGKTTVGRRLAARLDVPFVDGDDAHTDAAKTQMAQGIPLSETQRGPWLDRLHATLRDHADTGVVLACSALTVASRRHLAAALDVHFLALVVPEPVLAARLRERHQHFAGPDLLASQLATLELDAHVTTVDGTLSVDEAVSAAEEALA
jgi:gluconokinase